MIETLRYQQTANKIGLNNAIQNKNNESAFSTAPSFGGKIINFQSPFSKNEIGINTKLTTQKDIEMYNALTKVLSTSDAEQLSPLDNVSRLKKLDALLKNGTLLKNKSNDGSTTLENLYKIAQEQRTLNLDNAKILGQTIDALYKPETITQVFGDIPAEEKAKILQDPELDPRIRQNPSLLDVTSSGTCVSASFESHLARRHPAEFARWAQEITSPKESISFTINASAFNPSYLEAYNILKNMFEIKRNDNIIGSPKIVYIEVDNYQGIIQVKSLFADKIEWYLDEIKVKTKYHTAGLFITKLNIKDLNGNQLKFKLIGTGGETISKVFEILPQEVL